MWKEVPRATENLLKQYIEHIGRKKERKYHPSNEDWIHWIGIMAKDGRQWR